MGLIALHRKGLPFSGFSVAQYFGLLASFMITLFLETFLVEYYFLTILEVGGDGWGVGTDKRYSEIFTKRYNEIFTMQKIWVICSKLKYL